MMHGITRLCFFLSRYITWKAWAISKCLLGKEGYREEEGRIHSRTKKAFVIEAGKKGYFLASGL